MVLYLTSNKGIRSLLHKKKQWTRHPIPKKPVRTKEKKNPNGSVSSDMIAYSQLSTKP